MGVLNEKRCKRNPVYFYTQIRIRNWPQYKLDYASKMMCFPKLENWEFLE